MIDSALVIASQEINQFLRIRYDLNEDKVLMSSLVDQEGKVATQEENKIILTLVDVSQESTMVNGSVHREAGAGFLSKQPDLHLNLYILFSAYFNSMNYAEALKYLSATIAFLHAKPILNTSNSPNLASTEIEELRFSIQHQDSNSRNNLWSTLGAKYMPSVMYKLRMLTITDDSIRQQVESIREIDIDTKRRQN